MTLHIVQVGAQPDALRRAPAELLAAWPALDDVAQAVSAAGARVTVVQAAAQSAHVQRGDVAYRFVRVAGTRRGVRPIAATVARLRPDAVHLHGLRFALHARALKRALPDVPLLVQDHADAVPGTARRRLAGRLLRGIDAVAFTARAQAEAFIAAGVIAPHTRIVQVPESSSRFTPGDRAQARATFGIGAAPCVAWVGRLTDVKDPLLALAVFRRALEAVPDARMLCAFGDATLLPAIERALADDARLRQRVTLLGKRSHDEIELLLRAADVFVATSRREGSGFALIEALACGATPVVTDIPAFRQLTGNGSVGHLFAPGDADAGAAALTAALRAPPDRPRVRGHFDAHVSFDVIGRTLHAACAELAHARSPVVPRARHRHPRHVVLLVPGGVDRSGTERVIPCVLALVERLARSVDLHVLALRQETHACSYELLGAHVECVPAGSRWAALRALVRLHRHRRIDALHALWMHPQGTTAALAGALLDVPVLLHLNGGDLAAMPAVPFGGRATRPGRLRLRFAAAGASRVTAPSDAAAREAHAIGIVAERLTLGVALDRWPVRAPRARANGTPMRLLSVADVRPVKDYTTLLGAVSRLVGSGHDVRLDCVGLGTTHGSIEHGARARGIAHVVHCHEPMPHAALRALVDEAHALVVSSRYEGDPIAALEAAIAGVPVAGTAVGHLTEWAAADAALTCDTGDPAGLATCVARMIEDDALRLRLAANAQALACTHDADAAATRVLALYEALARQPERLWAPAPV